MKLLVTVLLNAIVAVGRVWLVCLAVGFGVLIAATAVFGPWPESRFQLAPESRLPRWFTPQSVELTRPSVVTVEMAYYALPFTPDVIFTLRDSRGTKLAEVEGKRRGWEPYTKGNNTEPTYEVITAAGITEIIEHRAPGPNFHITDDPAVKEWLGVK